MFAGIGIGVVLIAVIGGFLFGGGNVHILWQPAEFIIIFGAALGAFLISSPGGIVPLVFKSVSSIFGSGAITKAQFLELLSLLNTIFSKIRKDGLISIEAEIENPAKSPLFTKYKSVIANHHAMDFICDNLKVMITTNMPAYELESLMDVDIGAHHHVEMIPSDSITKIADALPGLGIVAAVLGVVVTMGKINEPPAVLGHHIGAALIGTFLGVLACYGFAGPIATNLENQAKAKGVYFEVIKVALVAFVGGAAPQMAVELGRRAIPGAERPSFTELEKGIRK